MVERLIFGSSKKVLLLGLDHSHLFVFIIKEHKFIRENLSWDCNWGSNEVICRVRIPKHFQKLVANCFIDDCCRSSVDKHISWLPELWGGDLPSFWSWSIELFLVGFGLELIHLDLLDMLGGIEFNFFIEVPIVILILVIVLLKDVKFIRLLLPDVFGGRAGWSCLLEIKLHEIE